MLTPLHQVYPNNAEAIWVLYDLRNPEACKHLHEQRAAWQEKSDLAALGPDHVVLMLFAGGAAATSTLLGKDVRRG